MIIHDGGDIARGALIEAQRLASLKNVPYLWGGNNPTAGFDCSGFVQWCYSVGGYPNLPKDVRRWTTYTIATLANTVPNGQQQPGDLIMPDLGHVGIFTANNLFIDAPTTGVMVGIHNFTNYNGGKYSVYRLVDPAGGVPVSGTGTIQDPVTGIVTGIADPILTAITNLQGPINALIQPFVIFGKVATWLTDGANWIRMATFVLGGILLLFGIVYLENNA